MAACHINADDVSLIYKQVDWSRDLQVGTHATPSSNTELKKK